MDNVFQKGIPLTIAWNLTKPDGTAFDLNGYAHRMFYTVGNRHKEVSGTSVSGNVISWVFPANEQTAAGDYTMTLMIYQNGSLFCKLTYANAFSLFHGSAAGGNSSQQQQTSNVVNLYSAAEYYLFQPVVPVVGDDGFWYVNGVRISDGSGNYIPSYYGVKYDPTTKWLYIYKGDPDVAGNPVVEIIKDIAVAFAAWQAEETARMKAEGQLGSGDPDYQSSRIRQEEIRQANEAVRQRNEGTKNGSAPGDGSRWGDFKQAQLDRAAAYAEEEGTKAGSSAGDGSRWGDYKTAEAERDTARETVEGTESSVAGDGTRWGAMKEVEGTDSSVAGDGSRWGAYKTAENNRDTARENAEGTASSTAGDGTRWGAYKSAEAARDAARLAAEGTAASTAGDGTRWGAFKTNESARNEAMAPLVGSYVCETAAATAAKTVAATGYVLGGGGAFKVKFTYANTAASPTLNVNSTGAKAIVFNGAVASASNSWGAGEVVEFYYDPTYDSNAGAFIGRSTVISVSQNTETGHAEINIGGVANPVASVEDVSQLGQVVTENPQFSIFDFGISGGGNLILTNRKTTCNHIPIEYNMVINKVSGGRFLVGYLNQFGVKVGESGWITKQSYDISADANTYSATYFYVMIDTSTEIIPIIACYNKEKRFSNNNEENLSILKMSCFSIVTSLTPDRLRVICNIQEKANLTIYNVPSGISYRVAVGESLQQSGAIAGADYESEWFATKKSLYLDYSGAKYLCIYFKRDDAGNIQSSDIENIVSNFKFELNEYAHSGNTIDLLWQYGIVDGTTGKLITSSTRKVSCKIKQADAIRLILDKNTNSHSFLIYGYNADGTIAFDSGWYTANSLNLQELVCESFRVVIDVNIAAEKDILLYVTEEYANEYKKTIGEFIGKSDLICVDLDNAPVMSQPLSELMAHASNMVIDDYGRVYIAYYCNENSTTEYSYDPNTYPKLVVSNLAKLSSKEEFVPIRANETIHNSDDTTLSQGNYPPYDPYLLLNGNFVIYYFTRNGNSLSLRYFDRLGKTWGNARQCTLKWTIGGNDFEVDFDCAGMKQCAESFGRTTGDFSRAIMSGGRFIYNTADQCYYIAFGTMAKVPAFIVKTSNFTAFEVVTITPEYDSNNINIYCSEPSIEFLDNNTIMLLSRRYAEGGLGSEGLVCAKYIIDSKQWSYARTFDIDAETTKPSIAKCNGQLFVAYNVKNNISSNGEEVSRSRMNFGLVDANFDFTPIAQFVRKTSIQYPVLVPYKGLLYITYTEDRRLLGFQHRSNISVTRLKLNP